MLYKEIVYIISDEVKLRSDDSFFTEDHILFLIDKVRSMLLKQRYSDIKKEIPESNYQTLCVNLEETNNINGVSCTGGHYLRSTSVLPSMMTIGSHRVTTSDLFQGNINFVSPDRFKYVGHNRFMKNQSYATIASDKHLYFKACNAQAYHLKKVKITGVFENSIEAAKMECDNIENGACDVLNMKFPMEESLVPMLTDVIVKELLGLKYTAADNKNNANDDLSDIAAYIRQQLAEGRRSDLYKNP